MQAALLMVSVPGELLETEPALTVIRTGLVSNVKSACLDDGERIARTCVLRPVLRTVLALMVPREMVLASANLDMADFNVLNVMMVITAISARRSVSRPV